MDWRLMWHGRLRSAWQALATVASEPNPFYEDWHLLPSLEQFDPEGEIDLLLLEEEGRLLGLLPLRRETSYYGRPIPHWRNWVHANCFLGQPLVAAGHERRFWRGVIDWCDRQPHFALFLHLAHCPLEGPLHAALRAELAADGRGAATVLREERALLRSQCSADTYWQAALSTRKRKELRRQHRRLGELGEVTISRQRDGADLEHWIEEFFALERAGWKGKAGSALACDPRTTRLFRESLHGAAAALRLERLTLRLDGRPLAMLASFVTPPGAYSYKTAFDEEYARFSPGVLLQRENLALIDDPAIGWVDSCAAPGHPMIDHLWRERRAIARHSIALGNSLRRAGFALLCRAETGAAPGGIA